MTDATGNTAEATAGTTRSMVADAGLSQRLVDGYMRTARGSVWVIVAVCVFIAAGMFALTGNPRSLTATAVPAVVLVAVYVLLRRYAAGQLRRATAAAYPVGEEITLTVSPDGIGMTTATGRSDVRAAAIRKVTVSGEAAVLRLARMPGASAAVIPRALLTDEDIAVLRRGRSSR
ncbi:hypothetical protein AB3M83_13105 [Microbacterium sp. 179-B 1A2 NHS]|uniref:hypothetical protein n=1 Tax=Microbacterium sp. 179-B 1A2 NHS TaxID=3142383 RepID=UPI0039A0559B